MYKASQIGIIGAGYVGGAMQYHFKESRIWDKYVSVPHTLDEVLAQPIIFVCLPTPYAKKATRKGQVVFRGADISAQIENLDKFPKGRIAVIKSTIPPGASDYFAKRYPQLNIIFNPEFLTAKYAKEDFSFPDKQILGYTNEKTKKICQNLMSLLPRAQSLIVRAIEAELIKYSINNYYAKNVVFANQLYDVCQKMGANYENVRAGFTIDKRINDSHFGIFHEGYRGYSGACLPKDMKTFIHFAKEQGINLELHKVIDKLNERLLKNGKKSGA